MYKKLQFLPFTVVSSILSLSFSSCTFMTSPTRLHPTGTKAAKIQTPASRNRKDWTWCSSCCSCFGSQLVRDQQWVADQNRKYEEWNPPHGAQEWISRALGGDRQGQGRGTDKVGGEDESPSPTPIYSELLCAPFECPQIWPKAPSLSRLLLAIHCFWPMYWNEHWCKNMIL